MNALLQGLVVAVIVAWSLSVMLGRFFPGASAALRQRLAAWAGAHGHARLAARLAAAPAAGEGCDGGCGSCRTGCATGTPSLPSAPADKSSPVRWRP